MTTACESRRSVDASIPAARGTAVTEAGTRFSVWAPRAERVSVRILSGGEERESPLEPKGRGVFDGIVAGVAAGADYVYALSCAGTVVIRADPASRSQPDGVHGPSRVIDPSTFRWSDAGWSPPPLADLVLYELHVGTFTSEGTFDA